MQKYDYLHYATKLPLRLIGLPFIAGMLKVAQAYACIVLICRFLAWGGEWVHFNGKRNRATIEQLIDLEILARKENEPRVEKRPLNPDAFARKFGVMIFTMNPEDNFYLFGGMKKDIVMERMQEICRQWEDNGTGESLKWELMCPGTDPFMDLDAILNGYINVKVKFEPK